MHRPDARPFLVVAVGLWLVATASSTSAQPSPFTARDTLDVAVATVLDLTEDGGRVAVAIRRPVDNAETDHRRFGDPTYLPPANVKLAIIDTRTGKTHEPFKTLINVRQASWTRDGERLALLLAEPPAAAGGLPRTRLYVWHAGEAAARALREVPLQGEARVSLNSDLEWTPDGSRVIVTLRTAEQDREAGRRFKTLTEGPVIVHASSEPFLEWDDLRRLDRVRQIADVDPATGAVTARVPRTKIAAYRVARDGSFITIAEDVTEKTDYDTIFGTLNTLRYIGADGVTRTVADGKDLKEVQVRWSDDGRTLAYSKKGDVFVQKIDEEKPRQLTGKKDDEGENGATPERAADPKGEGAEDAEKKKEAFSVVSFSRDGERLLATSKKGWYVIQVADGRRDQVLTLDEEDEHKNPRVTPIEWSPDGSFLYVAYAERDKWDRGIMRLELASRQLVPVIRDHRSYSNVRLSRDGGTFVFTMGDGQHPSELYAADSSFANIRKLTDLNPWAAQKRLPTSELVSYRDVDGRTLQGVLRYPVDYEPGRSYPTVFELYETFFDNPFNARAAFLTNHGYAVFHPSVNLVVGRPGEAWVKGVTTAANKLIEMGIADPDRLGVHGGSYGGYATALLITQTDRFKAAINISGKVNMVSFYTDSPRLGVRNTHAPEKSQDRIGGTLWEYPERYLEHSAVLRADRIKTPLLNITGDQDPNVPASQSREMYYALRRLGKDVEWVRYVNGGHRPPNSVEESVDFEKRILAWYDKHLKKEKSKTPAGT